MYNPIMNICIFGDSITWGAYDPVNGGWVTLLRNYLEGKDNDTTIYNLGICADDSYGLLKRFKIEAEPRKPDLVIFAIGANDIKHQQNESIPFDKFEDNINKLVSQANKFTKKIIILGITPVNEQLTTPRNKPPYNFRENKDVFKCNKILETITIKQKITFIPIPINFSGKDLCDGLHPNTEGHQKIFEKIKPVIENLIG
jgi:lysophospholipase L1-like esterase